MELRRTKTITVPVHGAAVRHEAVTLSVWPPPAPPNPDDTVNAWMMARIDAIAPFFPLTHTQLRHEWRNNRKLSPDSGLRLWAARKRSKRLNVNPFNY
jgi:hypothetical protein